MKPSRSVLVIHALQRAQTEMAELEELVMLSIARDAEETFLPDVSDPVHDQVNRLTKNCLAISYGISTSLASAKYIASGAIPDRGRKQSVPDCIVCSKPAVPRPRRGMCEKDYRAWLKSPFADVAEFTRMRNQESDDG